MIKKENPEFTVKVIPGKKFNITIGFCMNYGQIIFILIILNFKNSRAPISATLFQHPDPGGTQG